MELRARGDFLSDRTENGERVTGPGDLQLGTVLASPSWRGLRGALGWEVKLPDAADEGELGTDETDVRFGGTLGWSRGAWWVDGAVGLGVLGNPLRFANQDDVPMARLSGGWAGEWLLVRPALRADFATSRNPARVDGGVDVEVGRRWRGLAGARLGLTPAAADWAVRLGVGFGSPLSEPPPGG